MCPNGRSFPWCVGSVENVAGGPSALLPIPLGTPAPHCFAAPPPAQGITHELTSQRELRGCGGESEPLATCEILSNFVIPESRALTCVLGQSSLSLLCWGGCSTLRGTGAGLMLSALVRKESSSVASSAFWILPLPLFTVVVSMWVLAVSGLVHGCPLFQRHYLKREAEHLPSLHTNISFQKTVISEPDLNLPSVFSLPLPALP